MKRVELLSPAGDFDCLKAAITNGANAVYLGGKNFSARAFANNFDLDEIVKAIEYAHLRNVKVYVTFNTLLNEKEFSNAIKLVDFYYENNVDALLIQDLGLYYYVKNKYPDFELHCSTQMHIHNIEGIKTAKILGFKRVVIARESNINFIKEACKQDIEIETFVHGAICVSYSGQCLISSVSKNRSANKGLCAQCCRLKYKLFDQNNNEIKTDTEYLLSPKDMCLINDIPLLIQAGVSSFKIEGRLKSPAYVGYVTSIYRKAIDEYYKGREYHITQTEENNLKVLFNRNFTNDYLYNLDNLFGQNSPNHLGIPIGNTIKYDNNKLYIKLSDTLNQFDGIRIENYGCIVNKLYKDNLLVNHGNKNDIIYIECDKNFKGIVYKTLDYKLEQAIIQEDENKIPLDLKVIVKLNKNVLVQLKAFNDSFEYESDIIPFKAINAPISERNIINQFSKLNDTIYKINNIEVDLDDCFISISNLNKIRRNAILSFNKYRLDLFNRITLKPNVKYVEPIYEHKGEIIYKNGILLNNDIEYRFNYVINNESKYIKDDSCVISEFGGLLLENKNKIAYYTLNCSNSYGYEFLKKIGFNSIIVSSELSNDNIKDMIEQYEQRNNVLIKPYKYIKGNRVLMYLKTNPFKKYISNIDKCILKDYVNDYELNCHSDIIEIKERKWKDEIIYFDIVAS